MTRRDVFKLVLAFLITSWFAAFIMGCIAAGNNWDGTFWWISLGVVSFVLSTIGLYTLFES